MDGRAGSIVSTAIAWQAMMAAVRTRNSRKLRVCERGCDDSLGIAVPDQYSSVGAIEQYAVLLLLDQLSSEGLREGVTLSIHELRSLLLAAGSSESCDLSGVVYYGDT